MEIKRRKTRTVKIGDVSIGSNYPIVIQSMAKTSTSDIKKTATQINRLKVIGCQIARVAIRDLEDAESIKNIRKAIAIPLIGDIHFDYRLALEAIENGIDGIRLNPGNIYKKEQVKRIVRLAKEYRIPIRVGVNSGSLREDIRESKLVSSIPDPLSRRMVQSALDYISLLEDLHFYDITVSLKASDVLSTIQAYRKMAKLCSYPFHLGVTATGPPSSGTIKSALGIGVLLLEGIGDTIRVSLTSDPIEEVKTAKMILQALGLQRFLPEIISCPTCGRCRVDLVKIVKDLEEKLSTVNWQLSTRPMKLAVMGCVVNGPGEARDADIGIAFGERRGVIFKKDKIIDRTDPNRAIDILMSQIV